MYQKKSVYLKTFRSGRIAMFKKLVKLNLFEFASGSQFSQHLDDVLGHGGSNGQVSTGGLVSVLIGNPVDGVGDSLQFVRVRSTGNATVAFFGLVTEVFLLSLLAHLDTVGGFEAAQSHFEK